MSLYGFMHVHVPVGCFFFHKLNCDDCASIQQMADEKQVVSPVSGVACSGENQQDSYIYSNSANINQFRKWLQTSLHPCNSANTE